MSEQEFFRYFVNDVTVKEAEEFYATHTTKDERYWSLDPIDSYLPGYSCDDEAGFWVSLALDNSPCNLFALAFAHPWLRPTLACNRFASPALLELLSHDENRYTLYCLANNPYTPMHTLELLFLDHNREIRKNVFTNPACPENVLDIFSTDSSVEVLKAVLEHPNATEEIRAKARLCLTLEHGLDL